MSGRVRGVVTCPRSNRYLGNPRPHVAPMLAAGIAVGAGTDSSASNDDLDLLAEVRAIRDSETQIAASDLLEIATRGGARAIGVDQRLGTLEPGMFADLTVFELAADESPEALIIDRGGRATVRGVMSAGSWRVRDGSLLSADAGAAATATDAHRRATRALADL